jgi:TolB-like protein
MEGQSWIPRFTFVPAPSLRRLFHELKDRQVFRVATVYAVVGFVVVQIADIVFPALQLPDWTVSLVVALALLGFPVALVLAWAYDLTPEGVRRADAAPPEPADPAIRPGGRLTAGVGLGVLVGLIGFGGVVYMTGRDTGEGAEASIRSIAVLPFENLSLEEENAFFAAGIHDEVLAHLGRIADLRVISRTSVRSYAGSPKSMREIGRELGVRAVVEGSVQRQGDQIRVTAVLIDAEADRQLWADRYDRSLEDVFQLQTDIALAIAGALEATLTPEERRRVERSAPTEDLEAFRQYVLGMGHLDQRTHDSMRRSIPFFERAIARDSTYAEAWAALANAYTLLHDYGYMGLQEALATAQPALARVMMLDRELAYGSMAGLHMTRGDWSDALRALRLAAEVQPGSADIHSWRSWVSLLLGRTEEALEAARTAVEIDPFHPESVSNLAFSHLANGDATAALDALRNRRDGRPAFTTDHFYEGWALYQLGRHAEAREVLSGLETEWAGEGPRAILALSLIAVGDRAAARGVLSEILEREDSFAAGVVLTGLGEPEAAMEAFGQAEDWGRYWPILAVRYLPADLWGPVRGDPRFEQLRAERDRAALGPESRQRTVNVCWAPVWAAASATSR